MRRICFTADLHLVGSWKTPALERFRRIWIQHRPDALVLAGDTAISEVSRRALKVLRKIVKEEPIIIVMGNHDLWASKKALKYAENPDDILERFWVPAAREYRVHLLDLENWQTGSVCLAGCYGHYDLGFAVKGLQIDGKEVTERDYLKGACPSVDATTWNDVFHLPQKKGLYAIAAEQAARLRAHLEEAATFNGRLIVITHTVPFEELIGRTEGLDPARDFFRAYAGSTMLGKVLNEFHQSIDLVVCGHTHQKVGPINVQGIKAVNVGSDYGKPNAILLDTLSNQISFANEFVLVSSQ